MKNLELLLNRNCNMNCEYCGIKDNTINETISKLNNLIKILNSDITTCKILGGEPTINKDYLNVLNELHKREIKTEVYSNSKIKLEILKESLKYNIKYIISYHPSEISFKEFISNLKEINNLKLLSSIKVMWVDNEKCVNEFKLLKKMFNVPVYLEPIFKINDFKTDLYYFKLFKEKDLLQYSEILNIKNKYLNKSFYNMFIDKDDRKIKICDIKKYNLTYDYQNSEIFRCLTDCTNKINSDSNICSNTHCLCDLEYIKELL